MSAELFAAVAVEMAMPRWRFSRWREQDATHTLPISQGSLPGEGEGERTKKQTGASVLRINAGLALRRAAGASVPQMQ